MYTKQQIVSLTQRFEARSLPKAEWTHQAHLVVAIWYSYFHSYESSLGLVRENITKYNESVGTANTETSGYHETLTRFWLLLARKFLAENEFEKMEDAVNGFITSEYADKNSPLQYYSHERLFSREARQGWVTPELDRLPYS